VIHDVVPAADVLHRLVDEPVAALRNSRQRIQLG
jgi:hypothetical protein